MWKTSCTLLLTADCQYPVNIADSGCFYVNLNIFFIEKSIHLVGEIPEVDQGHEKLNSYMNKYTICKFLTCAGSHLRLSPDIKSNN